MLFAPLFSFSSCFVPFFELHREIFVAYLGRFPDQNIMVRWSHSSRSTRVFGARGDHFVQSLEAIFFAPVYLTEIRASDTLLPA
jgi:hypothetical protein